MYPTPAYRDSNVLNQPVPPGNPFFDTKTGSYKLAHTAGVVDGLSVDALPATVSPSFSTTQLTVFDLMGHGLPDNANMLIKAPVSYTRPFVSNTRRTDLLHGVRTLYDIGDSTPRKQVAIGAHSRIIKDAVETFGAYKEEKVPRETFEAALDTYLTNMCGDGQADPPLWRRALCNGGAPRNPGANLVQGLHILSEGRGRKMANGALVGLYIVKGVLTTTGTHGTARTDVYYLMGRRRIAAGHEGALGIKLFK